MNPTCYDNVSIKSFPLSAEGRKITSLFHLRLNREEAPCARYLHNVHVPLELQNYVDRRAVRVYSETLKVGGFASRMLPGEPTHLLLGAQAPDGVWAVAVPKVLTRARRYLTLGGLLLGVLGLACLTFSTLNFVAVATFVVSSHLLRTVIDIPTVSESDMRSAFQENS